MYLVHSIGEGETERLIAQFGRNCVFNDVFQPLLIDGRIVIIYIGLNVYGEPNIPLNIFRFEVFFGECGCGKSQYNGRTAHKLLLRHYAQR